MDFIVPISRLLRRASDEMIVARRPIEIGANGKWRSYEVSPGAYEAALAKIELGLATWATGRSGGAEELFCLPIGKKENWL